MTDKQRLVTIKPIPRNVAINQENIPDEPSLLKISPEVSLIKKIPIEFFMKYINENYSGFVCDLCSIPDVLKNFISKEEKKKMLKPCYIHDFLYRKNAPDPIEYNGYIFQRTRESVDSLFYDHLIENGVSMGTAIIAYHAVRIFGDSSFNILPIESKDFLTFEMLKMEYMALYKKNKRNFDRVLPVLLISSGIILIPVLTWMFSKKG